MKADISSLEVMQTAKISTSSREKSGFHSKMKRIKQTTCSFVPSWHKMATFEICICPVLICRCWGLVMPFSAQRLCRSSCRSEKCDWWTLSQGTQSKRQPRVDLDTRIKKIRGFTLFTVSHMGFLALCKHTDTALDNWHLTFFFLRAF